MFQFANREYLYALLIIPALVMIFIIAWQMRKRAIKNFGDMKIIKVLMEDVSLLRPIWKFGIAMLAMGFLILGIAGPQRGSKLKEVKRKGVELVICLDVSNSMLAEDIQPNRLERSKRAISKLLDELQNDKIGLIIFAGEAYVQLPITTDYAAAKMFLSTVNTQVVPTQGTAIGAAIELAMKSFTTDIEKNKAIIIITDGENHEDDAIAKAQEAADKGIIVHTIGMGLPKGAPIPIGNSGRSNFRTDRTGQIVISKLDETMLQQIASAGQGKYIRANNSQTGLNKLFEEINRMEQSEIESTAYSEYEDRFQYFIGVALLLLFLEFVILERKNKYFKGIRLFGN
ncbi:MAG: VWA domain-containing protein [Bacteroidales bacterium]|nr:VWA domain-containing protein [Bacteroidales bacterium]MCF8455466.1 VWA domain-containing protein [Bacteroidales bacterium]